jgi:hypothetical protein
MVEGPDDEHVVKHICGTLQLGEIECIKPYGGKDALIDGIGVRLKESDIGMLGIILDADTDLPARWQSVASHLRAAGYRNVPTQPEADGTIIESPASSLLPRVGVWLMPDNKLPGNLEDFLNFLVPDGDGLLTHADQAIASIPEGQRRFAHTKVAKARIHTWLAWQDEPGKPFGQAISARYLDLHMPVANVFASWLKRTFFS